MVHWRKPPEKQTCDRKRSDMTPCVITDGPVAYGFDSPHNTAPKCVGCGRTPRTTGVPEPADWQQQCDAYNVRKSRR